MNLVNKEDIVSGMMSYYRIVSVLERLQTVILRGVEGDIVELGCNIGTLGMYIQKYLEENNIDKSYHVYDSWQGLPKSSEQDEHLHDRKFKKGSCRTTIDKFLNTFQSRNIRVSIIHSGWFKDIPDREFPDTICFAFFDGDFYNSIIDSFDKVYHKVQKDGYIGRFFIPYEDAGELGDFLQEDCEVPEAVGLRDGTIRQVGPFIMWGCPPDEEITVEDCLPPDVVFEIEKKELLDRLGLDSKDESDEMLNKIDKAMFKNGMVTRKYLYRNKLNRLENKYKDTNNSYWVRLISWAKSQLLISTY